MKIVRQRTSLLTTPAGPVIIKAMERREFCQGMSWAALGAAGIFTLPGYGISKEAAVAKKVKAVTAKVISIKGTCSAHKVGDIATFTENGVEGKICIHALYSMLPAVFAMLYDVQFPWLANPETKTHACPDAANPLVFEISKVRET
jgi:uncharacterized repeat protein (TIGR04076 family)